MKTALERLDNAIAEAEMSIVEQVLCITRMQALEMDTKTAVALLLTFEKILIEHFHARALIIEMMREGKAG